MKKYFGTDGIRSRAGEFPLDKTGMRMLGSALAESFGAGGKTAPRFVSGRDTRESGAWIEQAIAEGIAGRGGVCVSAGEITTPGVAFLTASGGFDAGIVISASHNPYHDNGVKIFLPNGRKLDEESERFIEDRLHGDTESVKFAEGAGAANGTSLAADYVEHFAKDFAGLDLKGIKIVMDCANGAASRIAPGLFEGLGAEVVTICAEPDGRNINKDCGSLYLEKLCQEVVRTGSDLGVAFDGDADRSLFADADGNVVDGDAVLWMMAKHLKRRNALAQDLVVATVMSNIGLEIALSSIGVKLVRASVGDKYVLEELLKTGASVGGEQSGHIIFPHRSLVGDGIQTALFVLEAMKAAESSLSDLRKGFATYPQILVNVPVAEKIPFERIEGLPEVVDATEKELADSGRLLLRYSGTENLARVMIEGADQAEIESLANGIAGLIRSRIGA